ncbi:uncharacterized protein LOC117911530 [Vitis riparia]|uniref:Urease accessory protein UreH-like transmembrane domain-containing protein n=1 Tax=Vitis vinifera TaxID=29760 RepID=F6I101_VITVI|nr:chloroplast protein FOR GROWTH AND FERTILITY 2 [Vitis vinifera]XP_034681830.1 uncharacterized protein LOC117911530 [Vitis riparia]|eukprot:XP_002279051.1 PREDICTED: uncharacterized protein LOC100250325 [Vitis vinifera]
MERLIYSYSPIPSKVRLKPFSPLSPIPSLPPFDSSRLCFSSFSCTHLKRLNASTPHSSFLCSLAPLLASSSSSSAFQAESPDESVSPPSSLPQIVAGASQQRKAATAGTITLLSALTILLIHPVLAQPAFATFQTAAKTGGPAAATVGGQLIRTELLSSAWTGFFAGCLHTLSGPDHLAALAPLSVGRSRMESAAVGALWGCGHDAGQMIFGLLFLLLKDRLHIEVIRTWGTRVVGFTLLVIGAMGIREASEVPTPCVAVENGECDVGTYEALENPTAKKKKIGFATFATGIVHGLQPDALMMVLPALALPSRLAGAAFLVMFLLGTVVAMASYTVFIGSCSQALKERVPRITEKLTWASSLIAIALGFAILISQFFGFSLY